MILHPLTVGLAGETENEQIVGFLHDVVEDTSYTFNDLLNEGFSPEVVDTLRHCSFGGKTFQSVEDGGGGVGGPLI